MCKSHTENDFNRSDISHSIVPPPYYQDTHDQRPPKRARAMTDAALDAAPDEGEEIEEEVSEEEVARARRRWLVRTLERRLRRDDLRARRRRRYARRRREAMKGTARPRDDDTPEDTPEAEIFRMRRFLRTYEHTRELEDSLIALGYMAEAERFRFGVDLHAVFRAGPDGLSGVAVDARRARLSRPLQAPDRRDDADD